MYSTLNASEHILTMVVLNSTLGKMRQVAKQMGITVKVLATEGKRYDSNNRVPLKVPKNRSYVKIIHPSEMLSLEEFWKQVNAL